MVYYKDFRKEGLTDYEIIKAAHDYANAHQECVMAENGKIYHIDLVPEPIYIQTNTNFNSSTIVIDDSKIEATMTGPVFIVGEPNRSGIVLSSKLPVFTSDVTIPISFEEPQLLEIEDLTEKNFIRFGDNGHTGCPRKELILVDKNGNIEVPLNEDFASPAQIRVFAIEQNNVLIENGHFITIANQGPQDYCYYYRGFKVQRSHVTFDTITYSIVDEGLTGSPYAGFIVASYVYDLTISNMTIQAHKTYYKWARPGEQQGTPMGTYVFQINESIDIKMKNIIQNNYKDETRWGPMATSYCKNILLDNCQLGRFDAHLGVTNVTITNSTIGWQGIKATGWGEMNIINTKVESRAMVTLRYDYGAFWNGNIYIINCIWEPFDDTHYCNVINACNFSIHDFGYPCMGPRQLYIDGLSAPNANIYIFGDYNNKCYDLNTYEPTSKLVAYNIIAKNLQICENPEHYPNLEIQGDIA